MFIYPTNLTAFEQHRLEEFLLVRGLKKYVWRYLVSTDGTYHKDYSNQLHSKSPFRGKITFADSFKMTVNEQEFGMKKKMYLLNLNTVEWDVPPIEVIYVNVAGAKDSEEIAMWPGERGHPCLVDLHSAESGERGGPVSTYAVGLVYNLCSILINVGNNPKCFKTSQRWSYCKHLKAFSAHREIIADGCSRDSAALIKCSYWQMLSIAKVILMKSACSRWIKKEIQMFSHFPDFCI